MKNKILKILSVIGIILGEVVIFGFVLKSNNPLFGSAVWLISNLCMIPNLEPIKS